MNVINAAKNNSIIVGLILAVGVAAVFWIFWFVGATQYQNEIDRWIDKGREAGYEIKWDRREEFGFPRRTTLRFVNLHWKNADGIEFHAGDLDITADLWETKNFTAKFKGQVAIDVPANADHYSLMLGGESGVAHVRVSDDGSWEESRIEMQQTRVGRAPDYLFMADNVKLSAMRPAKQPDTVKQAGLTLSGQATGVTLPAAMPQSFGPKMPQLAIDMRVMGAVPDFRNKDSVAAWNKKFGVVDFDKLNMEWGTLLLISKGTMGFDDDLQPEGAFAATIGHQEAVLETLMKEGFIAPSHENMLSSAMKLFAKPSPIQGENGVEVPVAVQLGGLFLGPVKIFSFPAIGWD